MQYRTYPLFGVLTLWKHKAVGFVYENTHFEIVAPPYMRGRRIAATSATAHAPRTPISVQAAPIHADAGL